MHYLLIKLISSYANVKNKEEKYNKISVLIVQRAQKTTAGLMLNFYNEIKK